MTEQPVSPSGVVMFDRTTGQNFDNSNFSAAGRDHINLNIHLATGGAGHFLSTTSRITEGVETSSSPVVQSTVQHPPLLTRVYRGFRSLLLQEPEGFPPLTVQNPKRDPPSPGPLPSLSDVVVLSDGSHITSVDSCSRLSLARQRVSGEEEVYERSLLSKGLGFPLYHPSPLDKPVRFGDFGILGQDGFESFGNLFDPNDQQEFSIGFPPRYDARRHARKLQEGQVVSSGVEDARSLAEGARRSTNRFEFRCRETQGAALALTSSAELESLTPKSRNQLKEYLCNHGSQLMRDLRRNQYLEPRQSLYVVTGTIKSDSWAIAVHTSPMREPYDLMVLARREGNPEVEFPTHEWTSWGSADARCGASSFVGKDGQREKDQCLFLRGFLLTPSPHGDQKSTPEANDDSHIGGSGSGSGSGSSHPKDSEHTGRKGDPARATQQDSRDSDHSAPSSGGSPQYQLQGSLDPRSLVQSFPTLMSESKHYYPSRCLNEMLLVDKHVDLAITHDDEWRRKIRDGYLDDEALSALITDLWQANVPIVSHGVATTLPIGARGQDYWQYQNAPESRPGVVLNEDKSLHDGKVLEGDICRPLQVPLPKMTCSMAEQRVDDDILGVIASFLCPATLVVAAQIHPVFWQRYIQQRYARVVIVGLDKTAKNRLSVIRDAPSLAQVVKHIYMKPWLVPVLTHSYQSRRENALKRLSAFIDPHSAKKQAQYRLQKRFSEDIDWLQTALAGFPNVESYTLDWDGSAEFHPEFYEAFLIPVLRLWQPTLRHLYLCLPPQTYVELSRFSMPQLESLEVCLDTGSMDSLNVNIHLDSLLVFINNLKDSLHSVSICTTPSSEGLDISRLLRHVGTFPHLRSFSITIPFDGGHLSSISPFTRFLQRHSETLESLALKTTRGSVHGKPVEHNGMNWIQAIVNSLNQPLPQLESLTLALRPLKAPLDLFREFLRLNSSTLKRLVLTDRSLTRDEIYHFILPPLSTHGRLKRLELRADSFSPQLLCSMATHLPNLHSLKLSFAECNRNPALFHSALRVCTCGVSQWTLRHLTMSGGPDGAWVRSLEAVLVECIPAIESVQELIEDN